MPNLLVATEDLATVIQAIQIMVAQSHRKVKNLIIVPITYIVFAQVIQQVAKSKINLV